MSISISNTFSNTFQAKVDLEDSVHFPGAFSQTPFPGAGGSNTGAGAWRFMQQELDGFIRKKSGLRQRKLSDYHQTSS
jgi:hypothetical protein